MDFKTFGVTPPQPGLERYNKLIKIKPVKLTSNYPFSQLSEGDFIQTLKKIELVYQNNDSFMKPAKKIGGGGKIIIFTM